MAQWYGGTHLCKQYKVRSESDSEYPSEMEECSTASTQILPEPGDRWAVGERYRHLLPKPQYCTVVAVVEMLQSWAGKQAYLSLVAWVLSSTVSCKGNWPTLTVGKEIRLEDKGSKVHNCLERQKGFKLRGFRPCCSQEPTYPAQPTTHSQRGNQSHFPNCSLGFYFPITLWRVTNITPSSNHC